MNYTTVNIQFKGKKSIDEAYSIQLVDLKDTIRALELPEMQHAQYELQLLLATVNKALFERKSFEKVLR